MVQRPGRRSPGVSMSATGAHPVTGSVISGAPPVEVCGAAPAGRESDSGDPDPGGSAPGMAGLDEPGSPVADADGLSSPVVGGVVGDVVVPVGLGGADKTGGPDVAGTADPAVGAVVGFVDGADGLGGVGVGGCRVLVDGVGVGGGSVAEAGVGGGAESGAVVVVTLAYEPNTQIKSTFCPSGTTAIGPESSLVRSPGGRHWPRNWQAQPSGVFG